MNINIISVINNFKFYTIYVISFCNNIYLWIVCILYAGVHSSSHYQNNRSVSLPNSGGNGNSNFFQHKHIQVVIFNIPS